METANKEALLKAFDTHYEKTKALSFVRSLMSFDAHTIAPKDALAVEERSKVMGHYALESFHHHNSKEYDQLIADLEAIQSELTPAMRRIIYLERREINRLKKINPKDYADYAVLLSKAQVVWEKAKEKNDFQAFAPTLEKIIGYVRKFAQAYQTVPGPLYNTLLDQYEEGNTIEQLDAFFATLKARIVPLLQNIQRSKKIIRTDFMKRPFPKHMQLAFGKELLGLIGYDLSRGVLAESVHPFTMEISPSDVRVTTHVYENNFISSIYSVIHEGGHGIYEQFIGPKVKGTLLGGGAAMSIHESQSRFYENILGRSLPFTKVVFPKLKKLFPKQFKGVTLKAYYEAINQVRASLIRTEADELTYSLHIMVRYELEKQLIAGDLAVKDLPLRWNELYRSYLGIRPKTYAEGCLQDVHWSGGSFGYFPSYALGNAISLQLLTSMEGQLAFDQVVASKNLIPIRDWFAKEVYSHGKLYPPFELLKKITGEGLNPNPYCDYLEKKFGQLYGISASR